MSDATRTRLFGWWTAFDDPLVVWLTAGSIAGLALAFLVLYLLRARGKLDRAQSAELMARWRSLAVVAAVMLGATLLGAAWVMGAVCLLSLFCYREYARVTGLFREKTISAVVVLGILVVTFAVVDHFDRLFFACSALAVGLLAVVTLPQDRPKGYLQRVALGVLGFLLFGYSLGYVGSLANAKDYRPVLLLLLVAVELNAAFAFCIGKSVGGPKLLPNTSPNKTVAGTAGAVVLTTAFVAVVGHFVFHDTAMDRPLRLLILGLLVSVPGQLGDLMLSAIKRDAQVKDTGAVVPGHGGLLDRFDSLLLVPPPFVHYLSLYLGPLAGPAQRIITGGE